MSSAKVGDCGGRATYSRHGYWVVTIYQYRGWSKVQEHHVWQPVSVDQVFDVNTVNEQLQASRLPLIAERVEDELRLSPVVGRRDVSFEGIRLKRFLKKYYGIIGERRRPVSWDISIDLPD